MSPEPSPKKYTITFNPKQTEKLDRLAERMGVKRAEAVREAIKMLSVIVRELDSPNKSLQIADKENQEVVKELITLLDE